MKQKQTIQKGFTLIELLVVLSIMTLLMSAVVINFNRTRAARSAILAQNETVTNIRKAQSYMLSSRNVNGNIAAKFYLLRFETGSSSYKIQAIDANYNLSDVETVVEPNSVVISNITIGASNTVTSCVEVLFAAPFGKMYLNADPSCTDNIVDIAKNPTSLYSLNDQIVKMRLSPTNGAAPKTLSLHSLTGRIDAE